MTKANVIVALDGTKSGAHVLNWCAKNIFPTAGKVTFLHVYKFQPVQKQFCASIGGPIFPEDEVEDTNQFLAEQARRKGKQILQAYSQEAAKLGFKPDKLVTLEAEVNNSSVKETILSYVKNLFPAELKGAENGEQEDAEEEEGEKSNVVPPDFIVCGTRGLGAMGRAFAGSVSDFLAHNAPCSVVVVKELGGGRNGRQEEVDVDVFEGFE
mmetsp:Transcript_25436/g.35457  ORF Transcript_25436/g.35457 Transcript_25436/m.35457 type:complete len:211 (-) Transcript_25436:87-719(-)|eukprot:CAMPEP_0184486644 /NCGR_PEP_ID=MMETSP0113_2-20130426/8119_1 /TAXON_ID=91329 /ORGANISM="Norrisiella sphaerica, Strain BC52" /LENGTH=210 /DNA_ID=CAMNT_0026868613 /DNA_START=137 /DNA_END=769 /DNA_ORIENTATION=+